MRTLVLATLMLLAAPIAGAFDPTSLARPLRNGDFETTVWTEQTSGLTVRDFSGLPGHEHLRPVTGPDDDYAVVHCGGPRMVPAMNGNWVAPGWSVDGFVCIEREGDNTFARFSPGSERFTAWGHATLRQDVGFTALAATYGTFVVKGLQAVTFEYRAPQATKAVFYVHWSDKDGNWAPHWPNTYTADLAAAADWTPAQVTMNIPADAEWFTIQITFMDAAKRDVAIDVDDFVAVGSVVLTEV